MQQPAPAAGFARGAITLALRQGLSAGLAALGLLLIARIIGSEAYGVYVAAQAYVLVVAVLAQMGLGLALVRSPTEPSAQDLDTAWLLLAVGGAVAGLVGWGLAGWLMPGESAVSTRAAVAVMLLVQIATLPSTVPLALLERRMAFGSIAVVELTGQATWLGVSFGLAQAGAGAWALPMGWTAQQLVLASAWHLLARHRPGSALSADAAGRLLSFGVRYSMALATWQLRPMVAPLILVGRFGTEAVGQVGMTGRLIEVLSLARNAVWRAGAPLLGRLSADPAATARVVTAGGAAAAAVTGALFAAVVVLRGPLDAILGPGWKTALDFFPAFAVQGLVAALTGMVPLALHVRGLALRVAAGNLVHVAVLAGTSWWAVGGHGLSGWAVAEAVSGATFLLFIQLCPVVLRRELVRLLLPPMLLLPAVAWFLFQPGVVSAAACVAALAGLAWIARRCWLQVRSVQ